MKNIFLTGAVGVGKSTVLQKIIEECCPKDELFGFCTRKISLEGDPRLDGKVYIYPAGGEISQDDAYCVGDILLPRGCEPYPKVFDTEGVRMLTGIPSGAFVLMDELGFLESSAAKFREKVMEIIEGDYLVLGVVKPKKLPFLNAIRENPETAVFEVTENNRDLIIPEIIREFRSARVLEK